MPRGDKSSYTDKQKRQASHIEAGCEQKGLSTKAAEARVWAIVNKLAGGGKMKDTPMGQGKVRSNIGIAHANMDHHRNGHRFVSVVAAFAI